MLRKITAFALPIAALLGAYGYSALPLAAKEAQSARRASADTITIMVALDGFRADYLDRGLTPNLSALAAGGVRSSIQPSFPSVTVPNFYALMTGKTPDHHGIVGNEFESADKVPFGATDPATGQTNFWNKSWWQAGLPLWASIEAHGGKTAHFFYPAVGLDAGGNRPAQFRRFTRDIAPADEPAEFLKWLDGPAAAQPTFMTLYFELMDDEGHAHGPNSPEVNAALKTIDGAIGSLIAGLKQRNLLARTNLVIVADHGMAEVPPRQDIVLDDLISADMIRPVTLAAYAAIEPAKGVTIDAIAARLVGRHGHMECWRKEMLPARFQFGSNARIAPIICLADNGWNIVNREVLARRADRPAVTRGNHGFDPADPDMAAIFVGNGPAFRKGVRLPKFTNTNLYFLLAKLTGTPPEAGDGSLAPFKRGLTPSTR